MSPLLRDRAVVVELDPETSCLLNHAIGVSVVEDIPVSVDLDYAAKVVPRRIHRFVRRFVGINVEIAVAYDHATILKALLWVLVVA